MRLLADTHILIWQFVGDPRFRGKIAKPILDPDNEVMVSDVSLWEIAIKVQQGKIYFDMRDIEAEIEELGYVRLPLQRSHIMPVAGLKRHHGDPFDHLLIAQAMAEDVAILTADREFKMYPVRLAV